MSVATLENYFSDSMADPMESAAGRVPYTEGDSTGAYLTFSSEFLSVAWSDNESGDYQIYIQGFTQAQGMERVGEKRQITVSQADSYIPSIVRQNSSVYLAWNELFVSAHD